MSNRIRTFVISAVVVCAAVLYIARLDRVPPFLSTDETAFGLQAQSIATTAHDTNGRLLPVYFQVFENVWFHPALVYAMAPVLAVVRPAPWAVRLPTTIVALCNILLVFLLARRLGAASIAAISASVVLAVTPAHLLHGRLACDYLFPVPFVLAWLLLMVDAVRSPSSWRFVAAGCVLGLGLYTYIASLVTMPVCLLLTYAGLFTSGERRMRPYVLVTAGFLLLVLPIVLYLAARPDVYAGFVGRYGGTSVDLDVLHHPGAVFGTHLIVERWPIYRSFFEPTFLFERAETHVMSSTYSTGVFLKAMKVLVPLGVYHILRNRRTSFTTLLLATCLASPLAASLIPEKYAIDRALVLLPTFALIAAFGVDWLLEPRPRLIAWPARIVCVSLFVWMGLQFNDFYREYSTAYAIRAGFWFDGNHPGAFEPIVDQHPPDDPRLIYLSAALPRIRDHWKLYLLRRGRKDLLKRTVYFSQEDLHLDALSAGTLLLTGADDPVERSFQKIPAVRAVARVTELDGSPSFTIFQRTSSSIVYSFDGTYSAKVDLVCRPPNRESVCVTLATTASCPSMDTITVANNLAIDRCGYLDQAVLTDAGRYSAASTRFGFPVIGDFATPGPIRLSGRGTAQGSVYELNFSLTKQN